MSYRSGPYSKSLHHHAHDHGRPAQRPPAPPHQKRPPPKIPRGAYAIVHAGKQVRFGPVVFWIVIGTIVLLGILVGGDGDLFCVSR